VPSFFIRGCMWNLPMKYLPLLCFVLILSCQKKIEIPSTADEQYGRWFVGQSSAVLDSLISYRDISTRQDSLARASMNLYAGKTGTFTATLTDTFNASYTLGWKTPSIVRRDTLYPLIVYLHGGTGTALSTKGEKAYEMLSPLSDSFNLFLASPSANRETPWWSPGGMSRVLQTIRFMTLCYPVNPEKIFLAGVSDGATGCWAAANTIWAPFAGFIAVSGYGGMLFQLGMKLYPQNFMQRPIINVNAGKDHIYPVESVRQFISWCIANGASVDSVFYADEKHGFDYREKEWGHFARFIRTCAKTGPLSSLSCEFVPRFPVCADNVIGSNPAEPSEGEQFLNGYWTGDTLRVKAVSVVSALVSFPGKNRSIFISVNGGAYHSVSPLDMNPRLLFSLVRHNLFPRLMPSSVYLIKIR
jgi:pimeloyl-ACP methyl ester carboxylesterase